MPLQKLIDGYLAFYKAYFEDDPSLYEKLTSKGQQPDTLVIACSDSRIDPAIVTASNPGDLFVIRNVAAIVPPYQNDHRHHGTSAAIEFAVKSLKVKHIIVMGHALCGGVQALANRETTNEIFDFIGPWIDIGRPALEAVSKAAAGKDSPRDRQKALEQALILTSLGNLMTFPWIRERVEEKDLNLHGWYFDLARGDLEEYDPQAGRFISLLDSNNPALQKGKETTDTAEAVSCNCQTDFSLEKLLAGHSG